MKYGEGGGGLYNIIFADLPFKKTTGDVTVFHIIA